MTSSEACIEEILRVVETRRHTFNIFCKSVAAFFLENPDLNGSPPVIHSVKSRLKDRRHLSEKIMRKSYEGDPITSENIFERITDIAGVRVLHLHQSQFSQIHTAITKQLEEQEWVLHEPPKAYTWDPESREFFAGHGGVQVEVKDSFYTSVHYVVRPRVGSPVSCEIQVRTLFEEIWGEIDHLINYPSPTESISCREQIRVLARLVGAGSRLTDSIFRTYYDYVEQNHS